MIMNGYRKEYKYIVGDDVLLDVRNRLSALMRIDRHQKGDHYEIRSIYFDSDSYSCYRENAAGVSAREKYRIRTYNHSDDKFVAEIKIRHRDTISKMTAKITRDLYDAMVFGTPQTAADALERAIIAARSAETSDRSARVLEKYLARISTEHYRPACIVGYERCAYVYDIGNVRITFDRNIYGSREYERMFDAALSGRPALENNLHVLEIKYDEFLPEEIRYILGGLRLERSACSKYALCLNTFTGGIQ